MRLLLAPVLVLMSLLPQAWAAPPAPPVYFDWFEYSGRDVAFDAPLPAVLMAIMVTGRPLKTLLLDRMPSMAACGIAVLLAALMHPLGIQLSHWIRQVYPIQESAQSKLESFAELLQTAPYPWLPYVMLALLPAICEELAFRGFILSGLRHIGNRRHAVIIASIFFAMSHGTAVQQAINAGLLGLLLGYLAVQSGNIFAGMSYHITHNAAALVLPGFVAGWLAQQDHKHWSWIATFAEDGSFTGYHPFIVAAGIIVAGAILRRFAKLSASLTYEEELSEAIRERSEQATAA